MAKAREDYEKTFMFAEMKEAAKEKMRARKAAMKVLEARPRGALIMRFYRHLKLARVIHALETNAPWSVEGVYRRYSDHTQTEWQRRRLVWQAMLSVPDVTVSKLKDGLLKLPPK